jgi:hypothetical protein
VANGALDNYIEMLITALIDGFKDESWTVRDAACIACGDFTAAFPAQVQPKLDELVHLWIAHLSDNITSVRENTAMSLVKAVAVYRGTPHDFSGTIATYIQENILKVRD